jgi:Na+/melibiose symporter-like transporter
VLLTQAGHIWYVTVFAVLIGGFAGAVILFVPQEVAFTTGGKDTEEGLYFAAFTFVNKSAMACAPLVIGVALSACGLCTCRAQSCSQPDDQLSFRGRACSGIFYLGSLAEVLHAGYTRRRTHVTMGLMPAA